MTPSLTSEKRKIVQRLFSIDSIYRALSFDLLYCIFYSLTGRRVIHIERIRWLVYLTLLLYVILFLFSKSDESCMRAFSWFQLELTVFIMAKIPCAGYRVSQKKNVNVYI